MGKFLSQVTSDDLGSGLGPAKKDGTKDEMGANMNNVDLPEETLQNNLDAPMNEKILLSIFIKYFI